MACNCGCNYGCSCSQDFFTSPCGCGYCCNITTTSTTTTTTTICVGEPCEEVNNAQCVIYTGPDLPCYGIQTGDNLVTILQLAIAELGLVCTTTTQP